MGKDKYIDDLLKKVLNETLEDKANEIMEKLKFNPPGSSFDYVQEGSVCEQCGGEVMEGSVCEQCSMKEGEVMEKLHGKQRKLDLNKNNKIDAGDFKLLRKGKKSSMGENEMEEGNAFTGALSRAKKEGKDTFEVDGKKYHVKESNDDEVLYRLENIEDSALFTEDEMVDIIERIIKEENNIKNTPTPAGYTYYEKAHKGSGKEEDDYMKLLAKKMKDYLKDGNEG